MMSEALLCAAMILALSCAGEQNREDRKLALESYAARLEQSGIVDRLAGIEERLAGIEARLDELSRKIDSGVVVTSAGKPGTQDAMQQKARRSLPARHSLDDGGSEGGEAGAEPAEEPEKEFDANARFELTIPEPNVTVKVVVWHAYRGKEKEAFEKTLKAFSSRYPKIDVDPQEVPFSALRDKIVVTVPRGTGPDLFVYAHNNIGDWLLKGDILVPLSSYIEKYDSFEALTRFMPDTVRALAYEGTLYGLPLAFKSHALFYNRKLVKKAPDSFDELVAAARTVAAAGGTGEDRVYGLIYDAGLLYNHAIWAQAFGTTILDEEGNPHLDTPEMLESVRLVRSLVAEHKILHDLNDSMASFLFNSGQAGFVIKGPWFLGEIDPEIDYGVALLPEVAPGKRGRPFLGSEGVFLSNCSKDKEVAFQVMRYIVSNEAAAVRYLEGGQLVPNKAIYQDSALSKKANPALDVFKRQAEYTVVMSSRPEMQAVWSTVDNALRKTIFGGADIADSFEQAQAKVAHDISGMGSR